MLFGTDFAVDTFNYNWLRKRGTNKKQPLKTFPYISESEICILGSQWAIPGLENKHIKDILLSTEDTVQVGGGGVGIDEFWEECYLLKSESWVSANLSFSGV